MTKERVDDLEGFASNDYKLFEATIKKKFKGELSDEIDNPIGIGTGSARLNSALSQGIPRGYIHEIFAPAGVGKTTLALEILGQAQSQGSLVGYLDMEQSLNESLVNSIRTLNTKKVDAAGNPLWMYKEGMVQETAENEDDLKTYRMLSGEEALRYAETFLSFFKNSVLVIDSIDSLVPEDVLNSKEIGEHTIGKLAKLLSDACRKLKGICKQNNSTLVFINQIRMNPGVLYGNPETTPGGNALKFYAVQRLNLRKGSKDENLTDKEGNLIGHKVRVKIEKNKLLTTNYEPEFYIIYGKGIDREREIAEIALETGVVRLEGKSYIFDDQTKVVGKEKYLNYLTDNPSVYKDIAKKVAELL